jgi:hypothetical protein
MEERGLRPGPVLNSKAYFSKIFNSKVPIVFYTSFRNFRILFGTCTKGGERAPPQTQYKFNTLFSKNSR